MQVIQKPWGFEEWLELNDKYCYKRIHFKAGNRCSLQYHEKKLETIYVESGEGFVSLPLDHEFTQCNEYFCMGLGTIDVIDYGPIGQISLARVPIKVGDSFTIEPLQIHRITATTDLTTLEVSTPEVDDCIRINDEWNRPNGKIESEHEQI
jgi:mannose-6-phosphate isomerase-like protein (cupin superfamily)